MRCMNFLLDLFEGEQKLFLQCWEERRSKIYDISYRLCTVRNYALYIHYTVYKCKYKQETQYSILFNIF